MLPNFPLLQSENGGFNMKNIEKYQKLIDEGVTPIRRFGLPEDVANCVLAAVSGRLDFATGQILNADGGFHIRRL